MYKNKKFSQALSDRWDMFGKEIAVDFLTKVLKYNLTTQLSDQKEMLKDFDFQIYNKKKLINVEVEVKVRGWDTRGRWQGWGTLDIPYRKMSNKASIFIMTNKHGDTIAFAKMKDILKKKYYKEKQTIYSNGEPEPFLGVPLELFKFYTRKDNSWIQIKETGEEV